jgi:hypothetical protein
MSDRLMSGKVQIMGKVRMLRKIQEQSKVQERLTQDGRREGRPRAKTAGRWGAAGMAVLGTVLGLFIPGIAAHAQEQSAPPPTPGIAESQSGSPKVMVEPGSLNFMSMPAGSISPSQLLKVTNTGNAPLNVTDLQLTGINLPEFAFASSCVLPVAPGSSCIVNVTFSPLVEGAHSAKVLINDDAMDSPQVVTLSGDASDPFALVVTGAGSASISAGQVTQYTLQVNTAPGFLGVIQVTCSGAPLGISCGPTPAAVSQPGDGAKSMPLPVMVKVGRTPAVNNSAPLAVAPGNYTLTMAANWGLITKKATVMLTVQ